MPFKPALGISDFRKLREEGAGYVDKTDFIAQLLDESTQVVLFPRPRRFGKTINLSALRCFLEKRPEDLSHLFRDLAVWQDPGARAHFQRHPVLYLSFKDVRADSWESAFRAIRLALQDLFLEHRDAITSATIAPEEANALQKLLDGEATEVRREQSVELLDRRVLCLDRAHAVLRAAVGGEPDDRSRSYPWNGLAESRSSNGAFVVIEVA